MKQITDVVMKGLVWLSYLENLVSYLLLSLFFGYDKLILKQGLLYKIVFICRFSYGE